MPWIRFSKKSSRRSEHVLKTSWKHIQFYRRRLEDVFKKFLQVSISYLSQGTAKKVKSLEWSCLLIKGVSETNKNEAKELKGGFLEMWLGTLGAILLGNLLTGKETTRAGESEFRAGKGTIRAGQGF